MQFATGQSNTGRRSRWRALGMLIAGGMLVLAGSSTGVGAQNPAARNETLRGMTWDSIKAMPDWSGMWTPGPPPPPQPGQPPRPPAGGGAGFGVGMPFKPVYQARADARMVRVRGVAAGGQDDIPLSNSGFCIPAGVPSNMSLVSHEYAFRPGQVTLILENSEVRRIYTDGRAHPGDDVSNPSFQGHSTGHWEGDTLVVETVQIYPEAELFFGNTVTEKTVIRERISLVQENILQIDTVVEDDELFTRPWTYTRYYRRENREAVPYESCTLADRAIKEGDKLRGIDFRLDRTPSGDAR